MVMAGSVSSDYLPSQGSSSVDGLSKIQQCQSVESLSEWRGSDQVENGTPSTSPLYWDSDDDDDAGPKPSDLFVTFTWKIENFSQISKRELRSNPFEIGGYKWYVLVYPQGCDVSNHLSLFLCVANHDKLLPGWSHYVQFTIAVLNKDPKKNKYSDTLHRFWKKEHDWGWKKFMELTKVTDGFVDDDNSLTIKAQVQVIRERAHRPFRCLDCQYRRELIRVYMSNVEQTCRRFVEERWRKINNLLDDKMKLSSFHAFWLAIDQTTRRYMSRDKTEVILKVVVKHFFVEKEVQSTFVMDSLYTGLKALENQRKVKKLRVHLLEKDELPAPIIFIENDMFVLADDLFLLLERAALEFHKFDSLSPSKVEKGLPSRTKDGCSGDEYLRDERRLTELGRRTLEIFVLAHIFSRIEIAYQEAVALKRQEELIREEEAAEQAENERKERRAKKKQAKQRRNNRKGKDRGNDEKSIGMLSEKSQPLKSSDEQVNEKLDSRGGISDASDLGEDDASEALQPDIIIEDRTVEQTGDVEKRSSSNMDDSSSTCSTDSVPSVVVNGPYKGNSWIGNKNNRNSSNRGKNQRKKDKQTSFLFDADLVLCDTSKDTGEPEGKLKSQIQAVEQKFTEKEEVVGTIAPSSSSSFASPSGEPEQSKDRHTTITAKEQVSSASCTTNHTKKSDHLSSSKSTMRSFSISKSEAPQRASTQSTATKGTSSSMSRPSSAPLIPVQKPSTPLVSPPWTVRSASSLGAQNFEPQSYRNAIMGIKTAVGSTTVRLTSQASSSSSTQSTSFSSSSSSAAAASAHDGISFGSFPKSHTWTGGQTYHRHLNDNCESAVPQGMIPDEFPHLDIINDLLDEDRMVGNYYHHDKYLPYTFPPDLDPLVVGACGFELPECYYDEISQMVYNSTYFPPSVHDLPLTDYPVVYGNGMDASFLQNQWGIDGTEVSMMNFGSGMDVNGYHPYQLPEYSYNMMYQPANRLKF